MYVERQVDGEWKVVRTDAHPSTTFIWQRTNTVRNDVQFLKGKYANSSVRSWDSHLSILPGRLKTTPLVSSCLIPETPY